MICWVVPACTLRAPILIDCIPVLVLSLRVGRQAGKARPICAAPPPSTPRRQRRFHPRRRRTGAGVSWAGGQAAAAGGSCGAGGLFLPACRGVVFPVLVLSLKVGGARRVQAGTRLWCDESKNILTSVVWKSVECSFLPSSKKIPISPPSTPVKYYGGFPPPAPRQKGLPCAAAPPSTPRRQRRLYPRRRRTGAGVSWAGRASPLAAGGSGGTWCDEGKNILTSVVM